MTNDDQQQRLRDEFQKLGLAGDRLVARFSKGQIILSGELNSFYQVQLAHLAVRILFPSVQVVLNVSVNDEAKTKE